jgi:hypothetical protein
MQFIGKGLSAAKEDGRVGADREASTTSSGVTVLSGRKSAADLARLFGVSPATISRPVAGISFVEEQSKTL